MSAIDNGCKTSCIPWVEEAVELQKLHLSEAGHHQDVTVRVVLEVLGRFNTATNMHHLHVFQKRII